MKDTLIQWKLPLSLTLGTISAAFGWFGWLIILYVLCMTGDWITGSAAAMRAGQWSSGKAKDGIWHKVGSVIIVMVAAGADMLIGSIINHLPAITLPFEYGVLLCPMVVVWTIAAELGSIAENAVKLGAPMPGFLEKALAVLEGAIDE